MQLSDRQRAMLRAMGVPTWSAPSTDGAPAEAAMAEPSHVAEPAPDLSGAGQTTPRSAAESAAESATAAGARPITAPRAEPAAAPSAQPVTAARAQPVTAARAQPVTAARAQPAGTPVEVLRDLPAEHPVARLDWPALQAAVSSCQACGLAASRTRTVFGTGHASAHWMIVGEAPGEQEDQQGEPFVGAAGQLLDAMLAAIGLTRQTDAPERQVYIANTLKCRPPRNRNPQPDELSRCEPYLLRQIGLVRPRLLLAMGRYAVQALLGTDEPIGKLRGRVHRYQGVPLVVTYHPAYLLRQPLDKAKAWEDLCLAASVVEQARVHTG